MPPKDYKRQLEEWVGARGIVLFGVAPLNERLQSKIFMAPEEIEGLDRAICMGVKLSRAVLNSLKDHPTLLYKWHYRQANIFLDRMAFELSLHIERLGFRALPIAASQIIDWKRQIGHLSHRHAAVEAGLGWLGRNNLLVTPRYGSQVRLVTVLTDMPLPTGTPLPFGCGDCWRCVEACPAKALGEKPENYDFHRCFEMIDAFSKKFNLGVHICGLCVKVCPGLESAIPRSISREA